MNRRSQVLAEGAAALGKSAVLVAGVPLAFVRMWILVPRPGNPLEISTWIGRDAWGHLVLGAVALLWIVATSRLLLDVGRAFGGRLVSPSASWSARWASRIAGLMLLVAAGNAIGAGAAVASIVVDPVATSSTGAPAALGSATPASPIEQQGTYVVKQGDCLESIAQRELGSASDWPALAHQNMGRLQPDGRRMTDASLIYPGWVLELPRRSGEPGVAAITSPVPPRVRAVKAPSQPGSAAPTAPDALSVRPSALVDTAPARTVSVARDTNGHAPKRLGAPSAPTAPPHRELTELAILGIGLIGAAAVARRLRLLRRVVECLRRPGETAAANEGKTSTATAAIDPLADTQLLDWVDAANRLLWLDFTTARDTEQLPEIQFVRAGPDGVELFLADPVAEAPHGFVPLDGGARWALDSTIGLEELEMLTAGCGRYEPALVPVGDAEDATYLVGLGPGRRLVLEDHPDGSSPDGPGADGSSASARALSGMLLALRSLPWTAELQVELVGIDGPPPDEHSHRVNVSSAGEIAALARSAVPDRRRRFASTWTSAVVVVAGGEEALDEELLESVGRVAGVICIGRCADARSTRLELRPGFTVLEPPGVQLRRATPDARQVALGSALLVQAGTEALARPKPKPKPRSTAIDDGRGEIEVRILRRVPDVSHWARPPSSKDRSRAVEVVAYLALHGGTSTSDRLRDAVFGQGERVASIGRVHNVCSAVRSSLGTASDGRAFLPASVEGRYRLDAAVSCDWLRFDALYAAAVCAGAEEASQLLEEALSLVEGQPAADVASGWRWMLGDGLATRIVSTVIDAAHHLASLAIAADDLDRARWALDRARPLEPWSEILARDAMVVADLAGDADTVRRAWHELERGLDILDGNEPSPQTRALFEQLTLKS